MGFIAGLKAGFSLYALGWLTGASLLSFLISAGLSLAFLLLSVLLFRR